MCSLAARQGVCFGLFLVVGVCGGPPWEVPTAAPPPPWFPPAAGFHPSALVTDAPDSPHRLVPGLRAEVHLGLAESDMTPEAIAEFEQALDAAGVAHTCEIYPGTLHGFTMADTAAFDPAALQRHWDRLLPLLDRALAKG
ncbi:dienelactone hydrolase family protein [Streptomyces sp. NPDC056323]|uniref:dienelactone hydrolase family protein n=1 Tax=Streptomyces sp. NPDC056323 TaxID=3345784 RepID=UPI0035DED550